MGGVCGGMCGGDGVVWSVMSGGWVKKWSMAKSVYRDGFV